MIKNLCLVILGVVVVDAILTDEEEWQKFKGEHNKLYKSNEEETYRFKVFQENLRKIREHNAKYEKGETSYTMGINKFSDLTNEEFKQIYVRGILPPKEKVSEPIYE